MKLTKKKELLKLPIAYVDKFNSAI
jgi:hypothetical protein